ncbi:MAG: hypothetical protein JNM36_11445, partial [Chitinophagales bacterium]|nr:hypothetical protein [Chitinophagales bacterium]
PMLSPYQFASNTPIQAIDLDGLEQYVKIMDMWLVGEGTSNPRIITNTYIILDRNNLRTREEALLFASYSDPDKYGYVGTLEIYNVRDSGDSPYLGEKPWVFYTSTPEDERHRVLAKLEHSGGGYVIYGKGGQGGPVLEGRKASGRVTSIDLSDLLDLYGMIRPDATPHDFIDEAAASLKKENFLLWNEKLLEIFVRLGQVLEAQGDYYDPLKEVYGIPDIKSSADTGICKECGGTILYNPDNTEDRPQHLKNVPPKPWYLREEELIKKHNKEKK